MKTRPRRSNLFTPISLHHAAKPLIAINLNASGTVGLYYKHTTEVAAALKLAERMNDGCFYSESAVDVVSRTSERLRLVFRLQL